jgi:hypothetical protein
MAEIKLCKDCKYSECSYCTNPAILTKSVVTGEPLIRSSTLLRHAGKCGLEAKYFEPKPSMFEKIIKFFKKG